MNKRHDRFFLVLLVSLALASSLYNLGKHEGVGKPAERVEEEVEAAMVEETSTIPDFAAILDVKSKKAEFFAFMKPFVDAENLRLGLIREQVKDLQKNRKLSQEQQEWLLGTAADYRLDWSGPGDIDYFQLLSRVDGIPVSLALVQAANESAWGTSRFALDANNFFGQWCFTEGCGLVPHRRPGGATYEVRKFDSVADSVRSYMHNLNSSHHYEAFREMRYKIRDQGRAVTGPALAHGLYAYSIRGQAYVDELQTMIAGNDLLRYDLQGTPEPVGPKAE